MLCAAGCSGCFRRASSVNVDDDVKTTTRAVVGQMAARRVADQSGRTAQSLYCAAELVDGAMRFRLLRLAAPASFSVPLTKRCHCPA
jgi:hypothetical protein